jgi:photosystem II stability/assembly factor-like uncharacterized protein
MSGNTLLVGTRKGLVNFQKTGADWRRTREAHLGISVPYVAPDLRTGITWCSLDHGHWGQKLKRSRDRGQTWDEVPAPKYPEGAQIKEGKPASLRYLWVFAPGGADEPNRLYYGTDPGGLFASDDGGETFSIVEGLWNHPSRQTQWFGGGRDEPGIHSVLVDPRNSRRILVGISCAGVFETTDGGKTWEPRNKGLVATFLPDPHAEIGHDAHLVMACRKNFDVLWQQNHCGIFKSIDGAKSWQAVSKEGTLPHFGFVVQADPENPQQAWVIPAVADEQRIAVDRALCVCRTDDGGTTWKTFRRGLPQQDCYDFAFRHGMDQQGDNLAFGTACGSLYISGDRGESWQALAGHLPPVYCVRFGLDD